MTARAERIEGLHAWTHRRRTLIELPYRRFDPALTGYGVHRGDLFGVLYDHAGRAGAEFRLGVTASSSRQSDNQIVALDDAGNEHGPFDVLLAADGARSRLRCAPPLGAHVREFPLGAVWFSGKCATVRGRLHQVTRGSRQLIGVLPVGDGRCSLFCALPAGGKAALERRGLGGAEAGDRRPLSRGRAAAGADRVDRRPGFHALPTGPPAALEPRPARLHRRRRPFHDAAPGAGREPRPAGRLGGRAGVGPGGDPDPPAALARAVAARRRQVMWSWRLSNLLGPVFQNEGRLLAAARDRLLPWMPGVPWVGRVMAGTMAGMQTGLFSRLKVEE